MPAPSMFQYQMNGQNAILHTNLAQGLVGDATQDGQPLDELADVVGQLSLAENDEIRYHGRSSGLYLISDSSQFKRPYWTFRPSAPLDRAQCVSRITSSSAAIHLS